jgi:hypothetical protein
MAAFSVSLSYTQSVGLLRRGISPSQGRYLHTGQHKPRINAYNTGIHALSGIRTHDPSIRASEESLCLKPRGYCDRQLLHIHENVSLLVSHNIPFDINQWKRLIQTSMKENCGFVKTSVPVKKNRYWIINTFPFQHSKRKLFSRVTSRKNGINIAVYIYVLRYVLHKLYEIHSNSHSRSFLTNWNVTFCSTWCILFDRRLCHCSLPFQLKCVLYRVWRSHRCDPTRLCLLGYTTV